MLDRLVGDLPHELAAPIPLVPGRKDAVERGVPAGKRQRRDAIEKRLPERSGLPKRLRVVFASVGPGNSADCAQVQLLWNGRPGGTPRKAKNPLSSRGWAGMNSRYQRSTSAASARSYKTGPAWTALGSGCARNAKEVTTPNCRRRRELPRRGPVRDRRLSRPPSRRPGRPSPRQGCRSSARSRE